MVFSYDVKGRLLDRQRWPFRLRLTAFCKPKDRLLLRRWCVSACWLDRIGIYITYKFITLWPQGRAPSAWRQTVKRVDLTVKRVPAVNNNMCNFAPSNNTFKT